MDDQSSLSGVGAAVTHYPSSKGPMEIASMPYPHLANAVAKMEREGRTDDPVYGVLVQRKDIMDAEHAAKIEAAEVTAEPAAGGIGHNGAPKAVGLDAVKEKIEDIRTEAKNWLDGSEIKTAAEAGEVEKLLEMLRAAKADGEVAKDEEKRPHMNAANAVQDRFNELFGQTQKVTGTAVTIETTIKNALTKWRTKIEADRMAEVNRLAAIAEAETAKAREAFQASQFSTDLVEREEANAQIDVARQAATDYSRVSSAKTTGLRTVHNVEVTNAKDLSIWFWNNRKDMLVAFMTEEARRTVRAMSGNVVINGVKNTKSQVAC